MTASSPGIKNYLPHSLLLHGLVVVLMVFLWKDQAPSSVRKNGEVAPEKKISEQIREIRKMRDAMAAEAKKRELEQAAAVQKARLEELPKTDKLLAEIEKNQKEVVAELEKIAESGQTMADLIEKQKKIGQDQEEAFRVLGGDGGQFSSAKKQFDEAAKLQKDAAAALASGSSSTSAWQEKEKMVVAAIAEKNRADTALKEALERLETSKTAGASASDLERQQRGIAQNLEPDVADANSALEAAKNSLEEAKSETGKVATKAKDLQEKANLAQAGATSAFHAAMSTGAPTAAPPSHFPELKLSPENNPTSAAEAVAEAAKLEKEAAEIRRRQRAAELAMIQKIPLDEAYNALAPETGSHTGTSDSKATTLAKAAEVVSEIAGRVRDMQSAASGRAQTETYLDWVRALDAADAPASELVKSGKPGTAVDLVAAMENRGKGSGGDHAGPGNGDSNFVRTGEDGASKPPVLTSAQVKTVPGRTVGSDGVGADWMTVDTWHIVGPFANVDRANRNLRFPPEERVDLSATYPGADGRPLKWEFIQSTKPALKPVQKSEAVFYAYTDVWFEEEQNLWVAIGCDDNAKIWIEDQLVYRSDDQNKGWDFAEALRRVHFKKGLNRVLYRVENGPNVVAYSMAIYLRNSDPLTTIKKN